MIWGHLVPNSVRTPLWMLSVCPSQPADSSDYSTLSQNFTNSSSALVRVLVAAGNTRHPTPFCCCLQRNCSQCFVGRRWLFMKDKNAKKPKTLSYGCIWFLILRWPHLLLRRETENQYYPAAVTRPQWRWNGTFISVRRHMKNSFQLKKKSSLRHFSKLSVLLFFPMLASGN